MQSDCDELTSQYLTGNHEVKTAKTSGHPFYRQEYVPNKTKQRKLHWFLNAQIQWWYFSASPGHVRIYSKTIVPIAQPNGQWITFLSYWYKVVIGICSHTTAKLGTPRQNSLSLLLECYLQLGWELVAGTIEDKSFHSNEISVWWSIPNSRNNRTEFLNKHGANGVPASMCK